MCTYVFISMFDLEIFTFACNKKGNQTMVCVIKFGMNKIYAW